MRFEEAFHRLLGHEGGYVNDPDDSGGETCWGITVAVARANGYEGPMEKMPVGFAKSVYRSQYWDPAACEHLPAGIRFDAFDAAVNSGVRQMALWLQRAAGAVADGKIGPQTLLAAERADPSRLLALFNGHRLLAMTDMRSWPSHSRGWARRIARNLLGAK